MSRIDRVKPVRRYSKARYPAHDDPDPATYPKPVAFPFQREMIRAATGLGLAASLFGCDSQDEGPSPPAQAEKPAAKRPTFENPTNPFILKKSGLPHMTSSYGTGQPSYVSDELARQVIDQVFAQEGFSLDRLVPYSKDGVTFRISGYSKRGIGYVYGSWKTLDDDAVINWMWLRQDRAHQIPDPKTPEEIKRWFELNEYKFRALPEALGKEAKRVNGMSEGPEKNAAFATLYKNYHDELLSMEEIRKLEEEAPKKKEFVAVISQFDGRYVSHDGRSQDNAEIQKLYEQYEKEKDPQKQQTISIKMERIRVQKALELLELNVREYIAWARTQGLQ